jgi:GWxTD domain-containing protein
MKIKIFFFTLLLSGSLLYGQNGSFNFEFDYAQFGYDSVSNYVEIYYSFNQASLKPKITDSASYIDGVLKVIIIDTVKNDTTVNREWRVTYQMIDTADLRSKSLLGVVGLTIPEGSYRSEISGYDYNDNTKIKVIKESFTVVPFLKPGDKAKISDVQLASRVIQDSENKNSIFYKNSLEVIPIPVSVFGENQPVLFYYNEIYNISGPDSVPLRYNTLILNSSREVVINKDKNMSRNIVSRVEVGSVPVNKLPTDTYTLIVNLIDSTTNYGVSSSKKFFVYNPSIVRRDTVGSAGGDVLASQFGVMSEEELDDLFDKSRYVATSGETDQYKKITTAEGKKEFLYRFWKSRDNSPATARNEYYEEYVERAQASNSRFGSITRKGWKTDRGRVLLTYGEPNEIERFPNETDSKPYEIWYYNEIEGGVYFVFADLTGFSDYQLVHSTMRGELKDDNWSRRVSSF